MPSPEPRSTVEVSINGERRQVPADLSLTELLAWLDIPSDRVAVELNRVIVPKPRWEESRLSGGEEIEIVHFVGGG